MSNNFECFVFKEEATKANENFYRNKFVFNGFIWKKTVGVGIIIKKFLNLQGLF